MKGETGVSVQKLTLTAMAWREDCVGQAAEGSRRLAIGSDRATDVAAVPGIEFALQSGGLDHRPGFHQAHQPLGSNPSFLKPASSSLAACTSSCRRSAEEL